MRRGTKSVLFGVHQFLLHPILVLMAWRRLFGFPMDPRVWVCAFVHDLGYIGKAEMDSEDGERHVLLGALLAGVFGAEWFRMCAGHSRHYAKQHGLTLSKLYAADKYAFALYPTWLYLFLGRWSGELAEYRENTHRANFLGLHLTDAQWKSALNYVMVDLATSGANAAPYVNRSCRGKADAE